MPNLIRPSLAAGEVSPKIYGRVDLAKYHIGAKKLDNVIVHASGGGSNRPGTKYIALSAIDFANGRENVLKIKLQFNTETEVLLEFTDEKMRVIYQDGIVQSGGSDYELVTPFLDAELLEIRWAEFANALFMVHPNHPPQLLEATALDSFTITDIDFDVNANELDFNLMSIDRGSAGNGRTWKYQIGTIDESGETLPSETLEETTSNPWSSGEKIEVFWNDLTSGYETWVNTSGSEWRTTNNYDAPEKVFESQDEKGMTLGTLGSLNPGEYYHTGSGASFIYVRLTGSGDPNAASKGTITFMKPDESQFRVYKNGNGYFGWIGSTFVPWFIDDNIQPLVDDSPQIEYNPFDEDYPGAVGIYQQRAWYARTDDDLQRIWATKTASYKNFAYSSPAKDTDSIDARIFSSELNEIRHIVPLKDLYLFTSHGEWIVTRGANSDALTPSTTSFDDQGNVGVSNLRPLIVNDTALFVEKGTGYVNDFFYTITKDKFSSTNQSILATHLVEGYEIVSWCYQQKPDSIIWCVRDDGVLLSLTYVRDHEVWAWCQHHTDGKIKAVGCHREDGEDKVYMTVERETQLEFDRTGGPYGLGNYTDLGSNQIRLKLLSSVGDAVTVGDKISLYYVDNWKQYKFQNVPIVNINDFGIYFEVDIDISPNSVSVFPEMKAFHKIIKTNYFLERLTKRMSENENLKDAIHVDCSITIDNRERSELPYDSTTPVINITTAVAAVAGNIPSGSAVTINSLNYDLSGFNLQTEDFLLYDPLDTDITWRVRLDDSSPTATTATGTLVTAMPEKYQGQDTGYFDWLKYRYPTPFDDDIKFYYLGKLLAGITDEFAVIGDGIIYENGSPIPGSYNYNIGEAYLLLPYDQGVSVIHYGLKYNSDFETLNVEFDMGGGTAQGKTKKIDAVTLRVERSSQCKVGPDFDNLTEALDFPGAESGDNELYTGDVYQLISQDWNEQGRIAIRQDKPLPLTINAIIPNVVTG